MSKDLLDAYIAHRATSAPLPGGSAPLISSAMFKLERSNPGQPAKRWDTKFSQEGSLRTSSTLKAASMVKNPHEVISLGTARPAAQYYPWQSLTINARNVSQDRRPATINGEASHNNESLARMSCTKGETNYDLGLALNYSFAAGSPQLLRFVTEHVDIIHHPPYQDWTSSLTCGTTSALDIVFRMLCDRGDTILCESYTYPGTIEAAKGLDIRLEGIGMDEIGLLPDELDATLKQWDLSRGPKPTLLYTIPSGQNPTGATQGVERRKAIYEVAERHDLIIVEDDPYYFIRLGTSPASDDPRECSPGKRRNRYLRSLQPSYLSLDRSGRVLRLDATSKILAPGLRCGWITGCSQLIDKFISYTEMSTIAPSGPSQILLYKLLDETWGHAGFIDWLDLLSSQFRQRLQTLVTACERHLPKGLCTWVTPSAGMFIWLKVDWCQHPCAKSAGSEDERSSVMDIEDRVYIAARSHGVLISKGTWFAADKASVRDVFFRLTFAAATSDADLETAIVRFGKALREEFRLSR